MDKQQELRELLAKFTGTTSEISIRVHGWDLKDLEKLRADYNASNDTEAFWRTPCATLNYFGLSMKISNLSVFVNSVEVEFSEPTWKFKKTA